MHGHCIEYKINGDSFTSEYIDGKRQGKGTYYYADGRVESIEFEDDELIS